MGNLWPSFVIKCFGNAILKDILRFINGKILRKQKQSRTNFCNALTDCLAQAAQFYILNKNE